MVPPFKYVYSNNALTRRLFGEAGFDLRDSPLYSRKVYSGTEVRRRMAHGEDWRALVPPAVAKVLEDIDGIGRVREITGGDL